MTTKQATTSKPTTPTTTVKPARTFAEWKREALTARTNYLRLAEELEANWPVWVKQQKTYATKDEACKAILGVTAAALRMRKARETAKANGGQLKADQRIKVTLIEQQPASTAAPTNERNGVTPSTPTAPSSERNDVTAAQPVKQDAVLMALSVLGKLNPSDYKLPDAHHDVDALVKVLDLVIAKATVLRDRAWSDAGAPAVKRLAEHVSKTPRKAPAATVTVKPGRAGFVPVGQKVPTHTRRAAKVPAGASA